MSKLDLIENVNHHMYPDDLIQLHVGIPENTIYEYVSVDFLNGLVNYGRNHVAFLLARYGIGTSIGYEPIRYMEVTEENYQRYADKVTAEHHWELKGDDWLVFYETISSYMFMWYDRDVSDCFVERYSKGSCADVGIVNLEDFIKERLIKLRARDFMFRPKPKRELVDILVRAANKSRGWIRG